MTHALVLVLCAVSFACLALATERVQHALFARSIACGYARSLRIAGACGLLLALWLDVADEGWALGLVRYSGCTTLAAGLIYLALIACARRAGKKRL
ncbi:DUF3325 domain-containing protein [Caballeronia sp. Lep1P3]|uniref:DUF3325 domain-containing protein n=1 Tax=Caballeronia sp. Lep1P3 TaxID=2878150 RepID=UPI001FD56C83|nr:DUF3325 domain-containing protein [Caballeronia sp. Lep1P3]